MEVKLLVSTSTTRGGRWTSYEVGCARLSWQSACAQDALDQGRARADPSSVTFTHSILLLRPVDHPSFETEVLLVGNGIEQLNLRVVRIAFDDSDDLRSHDRLDPRTEGDLDDD